MKASATCVDFYRVIANCQDYLELKKRDSFTPGSGRCEIAGKADDFIQNLPSTTKSINELNKDVAKSLFDIVSHVEVSRGKMNVAKQHVLPLVGLAKAGNIDAQFCASVLFEFGLGYERNLPIAYALAAAAVAQNPPFGEERQDSIASKLTWKEQSIAIDYANRITKIITDLYDNPAIIIVD